MARICVVVAILAVMAVTPICAQQANSATGSLDINGSSSSGSAPFAATVELPGPVVGTVTGNANMPFILLVADDLDVGNTVFDIGLQIDLGLNQTVLVNGLDGSFGSYFANTGTTGSRVFQLSVPGGTTTGSVLSAFQVVVVDFTLASPFVSLTAATSLTFASNSGGNHAPVADAGLNRFANSNVCVTLDGSGSTDSDSDPLSYAWLQVGGTAVTLDTTDPELPTFIAPSTASVLTFQLTVNDGATTSAIAETIVAVQVVAATVSFASDVYPIFGVGGQGCDGCHTGVGAGGGMELDGTPAQVLAMIQMQVDDSTLMTGISGPRANPCDPANSPILLKPLDIATGGVAHSGGILFANTSDPDYITILTWLQEGAQDN
ncbi:MAG: hypothetical protein V3W41_12595 [Planctomycetota bacterium]